MNLLFCMSLSGTIIFLFALLVDLAALDKAGAGFVLKLYHIATLMYLVPFQTLKFKLLKIIGVTFHLKEKSLSSLHPIWSDKIPLNSSQNEYLLFSGLILAFFVFCMIVCVLFIFCHVWDYFHGIWKYRLLSEQREDAVLDRLLDERRYRCYRKRTALFQNEYTTSPFTSGILRHRIVLPERELSERERRYIYLHELSHIRNHDVLMKLLGLIAVALNWYNPCAYLLFLRSEKISEYASDEYALEDMGTDDLMAYSLLLIRLAQKEFPQYRLAKSFAASRAKKQLKERIEHMNKLRKSKTVTRTLTPLFAFVMVFSCVLTASAYEPVQTLVVNSHNSTKYMSPDSSDFYVFESNEDPIIDQNLNAVHLDFSESDTLIIDADGNVTPYLPSDIDTHVFCDHEYKACTIAKHTRNSSGGCTTSYFKGKQCQICGQLVIDDFIKETTYKACPHK